MPGVGREEEDFEEVGGGFGMVGRRVVGGFGAEDCLFWWGFEKGFLENRYRGDGDGCLEL